MNFDLPKDQNINSRQLSEMNIAEVRQKFGKRLEREVFPTFAIKDLGDVFDLAVRSSEEVDGDVPKGWYALRDQYKNSGRQESEEYKDLNKKIEKYENGLKVDLILRFKGSGEHLAVQVCSLHSGKKGCEFLEKKRDDLKFIYNIGELCRDNKDGYVIDNLEEKTPRVVINFIDNPADEDKITRAEAINNHAGKKISLYSCINLDYDIEDSEKRKIDKTNKDVILQINVLRQGINELKRIIKITGGKEEVERIINPKIEALEEAIKRRGGQK